MRPAPITPGRFLYILAPMTLDPRSGRPSPTTSPQSPASMPMPSNTAPLLSRSSRRMKPRWLVACGALIDGGFPYLVAERTPDQRVRWLCLCRPLSRRARRIAGRVEDSIYVDAGQHGRGFGRALLEGLIAESQARGFRQMIAVIGDSHQAASIALHRRAGLPPGRHLRGCRLQARPLARQRAHAARARCGRDDDAVTNSRCSMLNRGRCSAICRARAGPARVPARAA